MLQPWTPIQQVSSKSKPSSSTEHQETDEKREHRLRAAYENALSHHRDGDLELAYSSFYALVSELTDDSTPLFSTSSPVTTASRRPSKRPRFTSSRPVISPTNIPEWQRRLRYLALRNLAETCAAQGNHNQALIAFARALEDDNSDLVVWLGAARSAATIGHLHVSRRAYEAAIAMRPQHWLAVHLYRALLTAIGDADDDVVKNSSDSLYLSSKVQELALRRLNALREAHIQQPEQPPEILNLSELSWASLVETLRICLQRRLSGRNNLLVAHPVRFNTPPVPLEVPPQSNGECVDLDESRSSDDVIIVAQSRPLKRKHPDEATVNVDEIPDIDVAFPVEIIANPQTSKTQPNSAQPNVNQTHMQLVNPASPLVALSQPLTTTPTLANVTPSIPVAVAPAAPPKKPEIRRSARRAIATAAEAERRTTRTTAETINTQRGDSEMINALLRMCYEKFPSTLSSAVVSKVTPQLLQGATSDPIDVNVTMEPSSQFEQAEDSEPHRTSNWKRIVNERDEALAVWKCVQFSESSNFGPAELLLYILKQLSAIKVVQYFSTLALLWLTIRDRLNVNSPDILELSVQIVEALVVSGKKASKQKLRKFREASRIISLIDLSKIEPCSAISEQDGNAAQNLLSMRVVWLWGILHDSRGEMQLSFQAAERTLEIAKLIKTELNTNVVPDMAGPELSGYTWDGLEKFIKGRLSRLKSARDLEKAKEELNKSGDGDKEAPKRTISILAPSVRSSVRALSLDRWNQHDFKTEFSSSSEVDSWEIRMEAEVDLEPRLMLLSEACAAGGDIVGELVCFAVRLRMAVHNYTNKVRLENDPHSQYKDSGADSSDSSMALMSDLLIQIRRFVLLVKKISTSSYGHLRTNVAGTSGWSMADAAVIVTSTIITLTQLLISMIPLAKHSSAAVELGPAQKNRRLGFTRCMLAFPRCLLLLHRCQQPNTGTSSTSPSSSLEFEDSELTRKMLYVTSFCLRALEARGCCREEGTSGALIKMYAKYLNIRLSEIASQSCMRNPGREKRTSDANNEQNDKTISNDSIGNPISGDTDDESNSESSGSESNYDGVADPNYSWCDAQVIRHELAQCLECLYQIPELETVSGDSSVLGNERWLENACRVSKHIGLALIGSDSSGKESTMDLDVCNNIYFIYRKRIFEAVCLRRRDGGRVKRLREVLSRLAGALPEDAPDGVRMLSFHSLDTLVSDVVDSNEDITKQLANSASRIEKEWEKGSAPKSVNEPKNGDTTNLDRSVAPTVRDVQLSIMYFEVFSLHALSILDAYEAEYKKQKNAERRKRPKEVADRLVSASSECLIALRCRPWSIGAWILLGRIFVEISDLALDERELCFSSFGLYHTEDIASFGDGESIQTIFGRADACFGFAESLARSKWASSASMQAYPFNVGAVLGPAYDGNDDELWYGFGDDMDLFGALGLSNLTTSRPFLLGEPHPGLSPKNGSAAKPNKRLLASIRLGSTALQILRLREFRYFHTHWTKCTLDIKTSTHPSHQYPSRIVEMAQQALKLLREGLEMYDSIEADDGSKEEPQLLTQIHSRTTKKTPPRSQDHPQTMLQHHTQAQTQPQPQPTLHEETEIRSQAQSQAQPKPISLQSNSQPPSQSEPEPKTKTQSQRSPQSKSQTQPPFKLQVQEQPQAKKAEAVGSARLSNTEDKKINQSASLNGFNSTNIPISKNLKQPKWRTGYCALSRSRWYYSLIEAKLMRKCGRSHTEYLPVFQRALNENRALRVIQKLSCDVEPLYKLHSARMKVLRAIGDSNAMSVLTTLERYSFAKQKPIIVDVDDVVDDEDSVTVRRNAIAEDILSAMQACCDNRSGVLYAEFFFKATYCRALLLFEMLRDIRAGTIELSKLFRVDAAARVLDSGLDGVHRGYFYRMWNYRYTDTGMEPAVETERKLVRWRAKLLGLYGAVLRHSGEWRLLAAIIVRLRKRVSEDLPVDGAIVDDLIEAYAHCRRTSLVSSMERGIVTDAAAFEASFQTTWHIYAETLRLSHGARRVRITVMREEQGGTGEERLVQSGRPRCLVAIHSALRVEHVRWRAAVDGVVVDMQLLRNLPTGGRMTDVAEEVKAGYVESIRASAEKWPLDDKLNKMLGRRLNDLSGGDGVVAS